MCVRPQPSWQWNQGPGQHSCRLEGWEVVNATLCARNSHWHSDQSLGEAGPRQVRSSWSRLACHGMACAALFNITIVIPSPAPLALPFPAILASLLPLVSQLVSSWLHCYPTDRTIVPCGDRKRSQLPSLRIRVPCATP
jgi:hypothetical protein